MATELTKEQVKALVPLRPEDGHKGTFGHLFVLAGSRGFTGAAKLTCEAAGRSGVGLVTVGVPHPLGDVVAAGLTEAMSLRLRATQGESFSQEALEPALDFAANKDAAVLGPGISQHSDTAAFVHGFVARCPVPFLVDADGLNALSDNPSVIEKAVAPCVLTPHPGEMARLTSANTRDVQADRVGIAARFASARGCVVVLKGHRTVIAAPDGRAVLNPTGNEGMATGGTGDVLSGLVGGLLAQGMDAFEAACLGVYVHGLAGDFAAERFTARGMVAGDVVHALPDAWKALQA